MKVVTFGEIMLRLSTPGFTRFVQAQQFDATYGGGEANVAASLAQFGLASQFVSKVPKHEIGQAAVNHLRRFGVGTDYLVRGGDRLGIYFLETGASQRASKVIYDRADAAVTTLAPDEVDWDARVRRGAVVPLDGHHAGARRAPAPHAAGRARSGEGGGRDGLVRPQLPREAVDDRGGAGRRCAR